MTSTPVSMNNESLNGSWIDITNSSPPAQPIDEGSIEFLNNSNPVSVNTTSVMDPVQQNIGLISFQVERFLQEARGNQANVHNNNNNNLSNAPPSAKSLSTQKPKDPTSDNNVPGFYPSEGSDVSIENLGTKAILETLKQQQNWMEQKKQQQERNSANHPNDYYKHSNFYHHQHQVDLSKSQDSFADFQLSDSLSFISRLSGLEVDYAGNCFGCSNGAEMSCDDFDWLWNWSWQPEFFSGQEWKICTPKQDYLMRQRQLYSEKNHHHHHHHHHHGPNIFSSEDISLLFLTNILSIIIGAGITYSILMRKSNN